MPRDVREYQTWSTVAAGAIATVYVPFGLAVVTALWLQALGRGRRFRHRSR